MSRRWLFARVKASVRSVTRRLVELSQSFIKRIRGWAVRAHKPLPLRFLLGPEVSEERAMSGSLLTLSSIPPYDQAADLLGLSAVQGSLPILAVPDPAAF